MTNSKITVSNVKKKVKAEPTTKAKTILDLIVENSKARKELALDFFNHGDYPRVYFTPSGEVASPFTCEDRLRLNFEDMYNRKGETAKFRINQLIRGVSQDEHDEGKDYLVIQATAYVDDFAGNRKEWAFSIGVVTTPVWLKKVTGYSPETGEAVSIVDEILRFQDVKTIPFSKEQVEELSKHFYKVSLIIRGPNGKKYTCKSVEQFCGDYNEVCKQLMPKEA